MALGHNPKNSLKLLFQALLKNVIQRDRQTSDKEPTFVKQSDGTFTLTELNASGFGLRQSINPVFEDKLPDGRVQISDDYSNVVVMGRNPTARISYRDRLVQAAITSPEALPQIVRIPKRST